MRKKLQDKMFEVSYLFELLIALIVAVSILIFAGKMVMGLEDAFRNATLMAVLDGAIILAIGAELIKMLCKHTPETIIEVMAFALARQLIVGHAEPLQNLITVAAIAILFVVRRFLLNRHDMVETPDGLVEVDDITKEENA